MSKVFRVFLGLALIAGGLLFAFSTLFDLVQIGSCGSVRAGLPARPCPEGTGADILSLMAAVPAVLIGAAITASGRVALATWGLGFAGLGATFALAAFAPGAAQQIPTSMGATMGALFGAMGLPALLAAMFRPGSRRR